MGFQVIADYEALENVANKMLNTAGEYQKLLNELSQDFDVVGSFGTWQGIDSNKFREDYNKYID